MSFNVGSRAGRSPLPPSRAQREGESNRSEDGQASEIEDPMDAEDDDMAAMQAMMGFGGFGTTKNKKVSGNNAGGVRKEKKTEYRQYMNRNATPAPEEAVRQRYEDRPIELSADEAMEVAFRPADDGRSDQNPNRISWWFTMTMAWSISILASIFFLREVSPDFHQVHVRLLAVLSFLALTAGRAAYFSQVLIDCAGLVQDICIGLTGHVIGAYSRFESLFPVPENTEEPPRDEKVNGNLD
ncbi:hypothetical protein IL306_011955 [Fusarium sp. DS 682]|nr:hypothetical protein IL306_011955 [Fusarium sp. DS 682]